MKTARPLWLALSLALLVGCTKKQSVVVPSTPDGTVTAVATALSEDKPQVLWSCLPAKYQQDVQGVLTEFAAKADPEVWNETFAVLGKGVKMLREKKQFILNHPMVNFTPAAAKKDEIAANWDKAVTLLSDLLDSEIKTVDGIKNMDPEAFLASTGSKLFANVRDLANSISPEAETASLANLKDLKATVVETAGDKATIKTEMTGGKTKTMEFVRVDGKWLPAEMVSSWDREIAKIKSSIAQMDMGGKNKPMLLAQLKMADGVLDQLLAADTQDAFNQALSSIPGLGGPPPGFGDDGPAAGNSNATLGAGADDAKPESKEADSDSEE